jgi:hypothetical protein
MAVPVPVVMRRRERELAWCFLTAVVSSNTAEAIAKLVGVSSRGFGDEGCAATFAKDGGAGRALGRGEVVILSFLWEWRISRIDTEGLFDALAGVNARFPWGAVGLMWPCGAEQEQECNQVQRGAGVVFFAAQTLSQVVPVTTPGNGLLFPTESCFGALETEVCFRGSMSSKEMGYLPLSSVVPATTPGNGLLLPIESCFGALETEVCFCGSMSSKEMGYSLWRLRRSRSMRRPRRSRSMHGPVVGRLDMYRTKVLMYHTIVLMARLTKVRR